MDASVTASVGIGSETAATTLETGTITPTGADKVIYALVGSGASSPSDPTSVKYASTGGTGGESMSLMPDGVRVIGTFVKASVWKLVSPSASSGTIHATYAGSDDERWIIGIAVQDADGTENTQAFASGTTNSPTVNATSVSGDLVLGFLSVLNTGAGNPQLTAGQTSVYELESSTAGAGGIGTHESSGIERTTAAGTSTTISWTLSGSSNDWGLHAFAVNAASGAETLAVGTGVYTLTGNAVAIAKDEAPGLEVAHGTVEWLTSDTAGSTYAITGLAFQPKAIKFWWTGIASAGSDSATQAVDMRRGIGFAVGTAARRCVASYDDDGAATSDSSTCVYDDCIAATHSNAAARDGALDITAIAADGFTLTVDDQLPTGNITIFWTAWGGGDITVAEVGDFAEPASATTVSPTVTGFTSDGANQVIMFAGSQSTATINTPSAENGGMSFGVATGTSSANEWCVAGSTDHASATTDTDGIGGTGKVVAQAALASGTAFVTANLTAWNTDGFEITYAGTVVTNRKNAYLAIKGGNWAAGGYTINGNSGSATATVSGLAFAPKGVIIAGRMNAAQTASTGNAQDRMAIGVGTSTSSRRAQGVLNEDATASSNVEVNQVAEFDSVLAFPSTAGALLASYDINAMNSDGFQIIVDTAGGVASEWQGYLAFGDEAVPKELIVGTGSYTLSGQAVTLSKGDTLAVGAGAYTLTGQDVTLTAGAPPETLVVGTGAYTLTGQAVTLTQTQKLVVGAGAYTLTGQNVFLAKVVPGDRTALEFPSNGGSPSAFVAMYLDGADLPDIAPITVIDRYYPIQQTGFYTKFFHSRGDGTFAEKYFGTHPYPVGGSSGTVHNWEVSIDGTDIIVDENAYDTTVTKGRWYRQASIGENRTGLGEVDYYWDLDAGIDRIINHRSIATLTNATTSPKLTYGDAWWSQQQERLSGYLRGIQIYQEALSTTHIQALSLLETDAEVLAYCSTNSITSLWYLNMNPTASDVTDKSGNGRDMQWASGSTASTVVLEFLTVGTGTYVLTGNDVDIRDAKSLIVGTGSYALTGQAVTLTQGQSLAVGAGAYTLAGQDVGLKQDQSLAVGAGAYSLTGQDVTLTKGAVAETLDVGTGAYVLTGQDVLLRTDQSIIVGAGSYVLTGQDVGLDEGHALEVGTGAYDLTGQDVILLQDHRLAVGAGAYTLTGNDVGLEYSAVAALLVGTGVYTLVGQSVTLRDSASGDSDASHFIMRARRRRRR